MTTYLRLKHAGGETKNVEVTGFIGDADPKRAKYHRGLYIKWGELSGIYTFDMRRNRLTGAPFWSAADIKQAWAIWYKLSDPKGIHSRPASGKPTIHGCPAGVEDIVINNLRKWSV
jgi:hypothetical protein